MELKTVVSRLNEFARLRFAGSWDNVGLLVQPPSQRTVTAILLTNDLTEEVLDETIAVKADFVLSYHPPVFAPLKRITCDHWKQRIVGRCFEAGISVYSPHTAFDALKGGVNDWLVGAFGDADVKPIDCSTDSPQYSHQITVFSESQSKDAVGSLLTRVSSSVPNAKVVSDGSDVSRILCNKGDLTTCVALLSDGRDMRYIISKNECSPLPNTGMGRLATLRSDKTIAEVIQQVKVMTNLTHVRLALAVGHTLSTPVKTGAVCAGSGLSVLRDVKADVLLSGEMSHHDVLECTQTGRTVILVEHSNSERGFLAAVLQPKLTELFEKKVNVVVSQKDRDPLQTV